MDGDDSKCEIRHEDPAVPPPFYSNVSNVDFRDGRSMYMATKGGAEALARGWAEAFGGKNEEFDFMAGTTANSVVVGLTETDNIKKLPEDIKTDLVDDFKKQQCLPRLAKPEDVADGMYCFLSV